MATISEWEPIVRGLWAMKQTTKSGWTLRSHAVALNDGELLLVSPLSSMREEQLAATDALGKPTFFLAPNHFHHMGLGRALDRYKDATAVCGPQAAPRLAKQCPVPFADLDLLRERLPSHVELLVPTGTRGGEVFLKVTDGDDVVWVVGDAIFNETEPVTGATGMILRATGTWGPVKIGKTFVWLGLKDRAEYRRWFLDQLERDTPTVLAPAHGDTLRSAELSAMIRAEAERRL